MNTRRPTARVKPPSSGVKVRMYRQGHGDCFLLAFRKGRSRRAYFVLIDCGRKSGSTPTDLHADGIEFDDVIEELYKDCGGKLDLVVVTHEHQDHVSGFPKPGEDGHPFSKIEVHELWLAWTESEDDPTAQALRERYNDTLLSLALVHEKLSRLKGLEGQDTGLADEIAEFLELETGHAQGRDVLREMASAMGVAPADISAGPEQAFAAASNAPRIRGKRYKERLQGLRHMVKSEIKFLSPEDGPWPLPGLDEVRVYPFGPPRDAKLLTSLNPRKAEEFHVGPFALGSPGAGLFAAFEGEATASAAPFEPRYVIEQASVFETQITDVDQSHIYFAETYLAEGQEYRRIDGDWMGEAEGLALRLNSEVNNTSLVLCFELIDSGRTLLFTGDAQRGSWLSWADLAWDVDGRQVTARDLLGRCSLYKVGHHGSHNATLNGALDSPHPNLAWMALGPYAQDFVAMVPSNKTWAWGKKRPWRHPMKAIETALHEKTEGRILLIEPATPKKDAQAPQAEWDAFLDRTQIERFAVEHWVPDTPVGGNTT